MESFKPREALKPLLEKEGQIFTWIITGLAFIVPLFFLPLTTEFYVFNKVILLQYAVVFLLLIWAVRIFFEQGMRILKTPLNLAVLGLMLSYLLSTFIQSPNKVSAMSGQTGIILSVGLLYFIIINHFRGRKPAINIMAALIASSVALSWLAIFAYLGVFSNTGLDWIKPKFWTPSGSPLLTGIFMLLLAPGTLYWAFKSKAFLEKTLLLLAGALQILCLILIVSLFVDKTLTFNYLFPQYGWAIAVEGLKNIRTALLGVGPGNFLSAFSRFRPVALNNSSIWTMKFTANTNIYLNLLSTVGVLGLASYLWFAWVSLKREHFKGALINKVLYISLVTSFIIQLVFNANILVLFVTFLIAGLLQAMQMPVETDMGYEYKIKSQGTAWGVVAAILILAVAVFYWQGRVWAADYTFRKSLVAASENKGPETYNLQIKATMLNPYAENYRLAYSNTNLALANAIASQENLTDQDQDKVVRLISQAIREAKYAIGLNPLISDYWLNLARLYRNITNVAADADQWALAAYQEAVRTDPTSPLLRVDFGGMFYALQAYDQAILQFSQSINLKPDYANGYYNLAAAYREKQDWTNAFLNMEQAVNLVPVDSPDYQRAFEELEELRAKLPQKPEGEATEVLKEEERLSGPSPLPSPIPQTPKVELPEDTAPEVPEEGEEATKSRP